MINGAARIGHGAKLHPAVKEKGCVFFTCSCPGTQSGSAAHKATFFSGLVATCYAAPKQEQPTSPDWEPVEGDWYERDRALIAANKAKRAKK